MESKEFEELAKRIDSMQAKIDQQNAVINDYESRIKGIKGDLYSQEHRFLNSWLNLLSHFKNKDKEHFREKLSAVIQGFLPGTKATIVLGGSIVGILTLILMYQSNQLMLLQNRYLQKQIYIQADADRRDQLVNIMEKLYEPSEYYINLTRKISDVKLLPPIQPKYNAQARNESVLTYLNIKHNPLEPVESQELNSLQEVAFSLWNAVWQSSENKTLISEVSCESTDEKILRSVVLELAFLQKIKLDGVCLKYAFLQAAYFREASLRNANLNGAILIRAKLLEADMTSANMIGSNLIFARLNDAVLDEADLRSAIMRNAVLKGASLVKTDLRGADLTNAEFELAELDGTKLYGAKGLTCDQLTSARNWKLAKTDLKCEEPEATEQAQ